MDRVRAIADAVLYEGYLLWPYRKSAHEEPAALHLRRRVSARLERRPPPDDPPLMQAQCLLEARRRDATVDVTVRFLQVVERQVLRRRASTAGGGRGARGGRRAPSVLAGGGRARGRSAAGLALTRGRTPAAPAAIEIAAGSELETARRRRRGALRAQLAGAAGRGSGRRERLARGRWRGYGARRATPRPCPGGTREHALAHTLCSTHTMLHAARGAVRVAHRPAAAMARAGARPARTAAPGRCSSARPGDREHAAVLADHPRATIPRSPPRAPATCSTRARSTRCWCSTSSR